MKRWSIMLAVATLALTPALGSGQDSFTIKLKKPAKGTTTQVQSVETNVEKVKLTDGKGNVAQDNNTKTVLHSVYKETVLEMPEGKKKPTSLKRTYEKASVKVDDKTMDLPYQGKTILIDRKGGKYTFSYEGGGAITGNDAKWLDKEFNQNKAEDPDLESLLFPDKPVKLNETWKIPMAEVVKAFEKESLILDPDKCVGTGTLVKAYNKNGRQFGDVIIKLNLPVKAIKTPDGNVVMKDNPAIVMEMKGALCIDGSAEDGHGHFNMIFNGHGAFPADNPQYQLAISNSMTREQTTTELK
jgi:hypothetical protein